MGVLAVGSVVGCRTVTPDLELSHRLLLPSKQPDRSDVTMTSRARSARTERCFIPFREPSLREYREGKIAHYKNLLNMAYTQVLSVN